MLIFADPVEQGTTVVSHGSHVDGKVFRPTLSRKGHLSSIEKIAVSLKPLDLLGKSSSSDLGIHIVSELLTQSHDTLC